MVDPFWRTRAPAGSDDLVTRMGVAEVDVLTDCWLELAWGPVGADVVEHPATARINVIDGEATQTTARLLLPKRLVTAIRYSQSRPSIAMLPSATILHRGNRALGAQAAHAVRSAGYSEHGLRRKRSTSSAIKDAAIPSGTATRSFESGEIFVRVMVSGADARIGEHVD
jgi:hypothetical protein